MSKFDREQQRDEIIAMALSDDAPFDAIRDRFAMDEDAVKSAMRRWLRPGSYRAWRERVKRFRATHPRYKRTAERRARSAG